MSPHETVIQPQWPTAAPTVMQWTNTSHTCLPQKGSGSQLLSMLQKIFLTRVSHPGGNTSSESISVLLSICPAHGLKTREKKEEKKWVVSSTGSCDLCLSEGTKLKQSNQSPIVRAPVMWGGSSP